jgi:hypothetical protein
MAIVTEKWSERSYVPGQSAKQAFLVSGAGDMLAAAGSCPVAENATFSLDNRLRAGPPEIVSPDSPDTFICTFNFASPQSGGGSGGSSGGTGSLTLPPTYHPQISLSTEDIDRDAEGNAILASARESFAKPVKKRFPSIRYIYRRFESTFDGPRAIAYTGSVNIDRFFMPGFGFVDAGQAFCEGITVVQAYNRDAQAIEVQYAFELRSDGFKARVLDEGTKGWYYDSTTGAALNGQFTDFGGTLISSPIRLDGYGGPYDDNVYKVNAQDPSSLPSPPQGAEVELTDSAAFLKYKLYRELPFSGLTLTP